MILFTLWAPYENVHIVTRNVYNLNRTEIERERSLTRNVQFHIVQIGNSFKIKNTILLNENLAFFDRKTFWRHSGITAVMRYRRRMTQVVELNLYCLLRDTPSYVRQATERWSPLSYWISISLTKAPILKNFQCAPFTKSENWYDPFTKKKSRWQKIYIYILRKTLIILKAVASSWTAKKCWPKIPFIGCSNCLCGLVVKIVLFK